jgi:hypothetical protein
MVNISLLAKWRWRLLDNTQAVWKDVLISKYGELAVGKVELAEECKPCYASLWWRDICSIGVNWFLGSVYRNLGNGVQTSFWWDNWIGEIPLKDCFPRLFLISNQKHASVVEMWNSTVFDNCTGSIPELVEGVKVIYWKWWLAQIKTEHCLYHEWWVELEPGLCLKR